MVKKTPAPGPEKRERKPDRPLTPLAAKSLGKDTEAKPAITGDIEKKRGLAGRPDARNISKSGVETEPQPEDASPPNPESEPTEKKSVTTVKKSDSQPWFNQISLLVAGAILTLGANLFVSRSNGQNAIEVEREKAKSSLILQAIASSDASIAFRNIMFFVESKLIPDEDGSLVRAACKYLPVLPSAGAPPVQAISPSQYEGAFWSVVIDPAAKPQIERAVTAIEENKARFEIVSRATNVPWYVIGTIQWLEANDRFDASLRDGKRFSQNAGSSTMWEEAAIEAMRGIYPDGLNRASLGATLEAIERFNGLGYRGRGVSSPYLWGKTSGYTGGAYTGDATFVDNAVSKQLGAVPILRALNEDETIKLDDSGRRSSVSNSTNRPSDCPTKVDGSPTAGASPN